MQPFKNYLCKKCGELAQSNSKPTTSDCFLGDRHDWKELGDVGEILYECKKCKTQVKSKLRPASFGCPSGDMHEWVRI